MIDTGGHSERAHAILSASGSHRWLACPPSARLEMMFSDKSSDAAKEGTLAHELAELRLTKYFKKGIEPKTWKKRVDEFKEREQWDNEMLAHTEEYLDHIKAIVVGHKEKAFVSIEEKLDLSEWVPESFGTADCILIIGDTLYVRDLKYGKSPKGIVYAENNPQLQLYALGAYQKYGLLFPIKRINVGIEQPRLDHYDSWELSVDELLAFGEKAKQIAKLAFEGKGEFNPGEEQCRWCKARVNCRARADYNVQLAFKAETKPELINNDEIGEYLLKGLDIQSWLKDLQEYALSESLAGRTVAGWKAVEGISRRTITDEQKLVQILTKAGYEESLLYKPKEIEALGKLEKLVGKKEFASLSKDCVTKPPGKPTLVQETDKRQAITNQITAQEAFQQ